MFTPLTYHLILLLSDLAGENQIAAPEPINKAKFKDSIEKELKEPIRKKFYDELEQEYFHLIFVGQPTIILSNHKEIL